MAALERSYFIYWETDTKKHVQVGSLDPFLLLDFITDAEDILDAISKRNKTQNNNISPEM